MWIMADLNECITSCTKVAWYEHDIGLLNRCNTLEPCFLEWVAFYNQKIA